MNHMAKFIIIRHLATLTIKEKQVILVLLVKITNTHLLWPSISVYHLPQRSEGLSVYILQYLCNVPCSIICNSSKTDTP